MLSCSKWGLCCHSKSQMAMEKRRGKIKKKKKEEELPVRPQSPSCSYCRVLLVLLNKLWTLQNQGVMLYIICRTKQARLFLPASSCTGATTKRVCQKNASQEEGLVMKRQIHTSLWPLFSAWCSQVPLFFYPNGSVVSRSQYNFGANMQACVLWG